MVEPFKAGGDLYSQQSDLLVRVDGPNKICNILLGITGSVAAVKAPELICKLIDILGPQITIKVILTQGGKNFWDKSSTYDSVHWQKIQDVLANKYDRLHCGSTSHHCQLQVYESTDEWKMWDKLGDPVEHIVLRDWADACIVAPLSAHSLAKIAYGFCDDTLSCIIRAWDFGHYRRNDVQTNNTVETSNDKRRIGKPLFLVPAMNTAMWEHPLTEQQLNQIKSFGSNCVRIIPPQAKMLACGEIGIGAMADLSTIVHEVSKIICK